MTDWKNLTCEKCMFQIAGECRRFPPSCDEYGPDYPKVKWFEQFFPACAEYAEEGQVSHVVKSAVNVVFNTPFEPIWGKVE